MRGCVANLGSFEAAVLQQHSSSDTTAHTPTPLTATGTDSTNRGDVPTCTPQSLRQLQIRYHWLQAGISKQQKQVQDAAYQLEACAAALHAFAEADKCLQHEVSVALMPPTAQPITSQIVNQKLDELNMLIMVQEGRKCIEQGQHQTLIARLAPVLLASGPDTPPIEVSHQLAGFQLLQVQQDANCILSLHIVDCA